MESRKWEGEEEGEAAAVCAVCVRVVAVSPSPSSFCVPSLSTPSAVCSSSAVSSISASPSMASRPNRSRYSHRPTTSHSQPCTSTTLHAEAEAEEGGEPDTAQSPHERTRRSSTRGNAATTG